MLDTAMTINQDTLVSISITVKVILSQKKYLQGYFKFSATTKIHFNERILFSRKTSSKQTWLNVAKGPMQSSTHMKDSTCTGHWVTHSLDTLDQRSPHKKTNR